MIFGVTNILILIKTIKKMENKVKVWLARDKSGSIFAFSERPNKYKVYWAFAPSMQLDKSIFPSVKWEDDEPTEAYITLAEPQEQPKQEQPTPKQEIDWEQRRYEIVKDILIKSHFDKKNTLLYDSEIHSAISYADKIIDKLKKQSE